MFFILDMGVTTACSVEIGVVCFDVLVVVKVAVGVCAVAIGVVSPAPVGAACGPVLVIFVLVVVSVCDSLLVLLSVVSGACNVESDVVAFTVIEENCFVEVLVF